jgi:hypothetical protein
MPKPEHKPIPDVEHEYDVADVEHEDNMQASYEEVVDPEYDISADPDCEDSVQAEYVVDVADPDYDEAVEVPAFTEPAPLVAITFEADFAFEVGRAVLPLTQEQPHLVVWRGHLKERHPTTGLVQRVPVYRLADGYWDCCREEELRVA